MKTKETLNLCDACCEGYLHSKMRKEKCEYRGSDGQLSVHFSVCDNCKAELLNATDLLENKREWVRFKKMVDGIPLGYEIAQMRKEHHISQALAASIFGGGPVAFSKYENDDLIPDDSMVNLLKLAIAYPETVRRLAKLKGIGFEPNHSTKIITGTRVVMRDEHIKKSTFIDFAKYIHSDSVLLAEQRPISWVDEKQSFINKPSCSAIDVLQQILSTQKFRATKAVNAAAIPDVYKVYDEDSARNLEFASSKTSGNFKLEPESVTYGTC